MRNNFFYKILALFSAILLWLYATNQQNPLSEATYSVPLDVKNLPPTLVVSEKLPSVTVRLMGRKHLLDETTTKDIRAFLNLQNAKEGENSVEVTVTVPKDTQVVSVTPLKGEVNLTTISSKQISLRLQITSPPPEGYVTLSKQLTPSQVIVSGPRNILQKVAKATVAVDLSEQKVNFLQRLPVRIYDAEGNDLSDWLKVKPEVAETYVAVSSNQPRKQLSIKPILTGTLPKGKKVVRILVDPELVTVSGTQDAINKLFVIETKPIELSDKKQSFTTDVFLNLPDGVSAYPLPKARVEVSIANQ